MAHKQALLAEANQAYGELTEAVGGLSDSELTQVFLGVWGTREILIHIAAWDREMAAALERVSRGEKAYPDGKYDDFDDWNARFVAAREGMHPADILAEVDREHRAIIAAAETLPESDFAPEQPARGMFEGATTQHYREHAGQIRDWRKGR